MRLTLRPRGIMAADAVMALAIVGVLMSTLAVAVTRQTRASQRLAETRAAVRLAEATMIALQSGQTPPAAPEGAVVRVRRLEGTDAPPGNAWASVAVTINGRTSDLTGIVRADAVNGVAP